MSRSITNSFYCCFRNNQFYEFVSFIQLISFNCQHALSNRRSAAFEWFRKRGIGHTKILRFFNKTSMEDFALTDLEQLLGIATSIKEGWLEIDKAFALDEETTPLNVEERVKNLLSNEIKN